MLDLNGPTAVQSWLITSYPYQNQLIQTSRGKGSFDLASKAETKWLSRSCGGGMTAAAASIELYVDTAATVLPTAKLLLK